MSDNSTFLLTQFTNNLKTIKYVAKNKTIQFTIENFQIKHQNVKTKHVTLVFSDINEEDVKLDTDANTNDEKQIFQSFTQVSEYNPAQMVIMHKPGIELFLSMLHPSASLFEKPGTRKKAHEAYNNFATELEKHNITVFNTRDVLKLNPEKLKDLAIKSLKYKYIEEKDDIKDDELEKRLNYKKEVLSALTTDDLIDVILIQPTVELSFSKINTGINVENISCKPVGNLVFCRDQQITTKKGVIMGRLNSIQRAFETQILKLIFENLNIPIIGEMPDGCFLEGGDFMPINSDLCMLGIGLRTNELAAKYLMENDLLGTQRIALIIDKHDQNQDRMHLDTVFNILNKRTAVVLDFDTVPTDVKDISRKVNVYEKNKFGLYELNEEYKKIDFYAFLKREGFCNLIKVTHEQQLEYMINFLNVGNGNIISVNSELENVVREFDSGLNVNIKYIDFDGIKVMYGAAHCSTQVSRKCVQTNNSQFEFSG